ncbi:Splicing factor U2af large subunit B [Cardamine amara subsp. amara]|uniref:Splicing factor U2af large subunit B n=1 Tax=Cardamine amara subsp. amara TaxID=228776 RepID=A0ABD0ZK44_CARAN
MSRSRIIRLSNVVTEDDLESDEGYEDILNDLRDNGERFGKLVNVVINLKPPGVGKVFMEYEDLDAASTARLALNGIPLGLDNFIVAEYYPENMYAQGYLNA